MDMAQKLYNLLVVQYGAFIRDAAVFEIALILVSWAVIGVCEKAFGYKALPFKIGEKINSLIPIALSVIYWATKKAGSSDVLNNIFIGIALGAVGSKMYDLGGHYITDFISDKLQSFLRKKK